MNVEVNYLAVLVAAIAAMIVGFVYYSPYVMGKPWMKERGYTPEKLKGMQKEMGKWYALSFVAALITGYILFHIITLSLNFYHYSNEMTGIITAFWVWLGFLMPVQLTATIFSDNKNFKLFAMDTFHQLLSIVAMGAVIGLMI
ncbi:MAG TPA: DUF1761 domain-containing protein [Candidatus Saccharimonadales bacterium]|nr:DUF1761 domain-containing protein [Candidatus Saccharimonadales bacterium]